LKPYSYSVQEQGRGNNAVSVNTYRCLKSVLALLLRPGNYQKNGQTCLAKRRTEGSFDLHPPEHIERIISWKPAKRSEKRLYPLILGALDTGLRVEELISLLRPHVDLEALSLRVSNLEHVDTR